MGICKKVNWIFFILLSFGLSACGRFHIVEPISPPAAPSPLKRINTLQPVLKWKPSKNSDVSYDLIIYEAIQVQVGTGGYGGSVYREGLKSVYYREGLKKTEHKVEEPLKLGIQYYWAIRIRHENEVSAWSSYDPPFSLIGGIQPSRPFSFRTPDK